MNITHHKNGEINVLVEEAPYHPGYEDVGFELKEDYSEVYLQIKAKLKDYHDLCLKGRFNEATDVAIELTDLTIKLETVTLPNV